MPPLRRALLRALASGVALLPGLALAAATFYQGGPARSAFRVAPVAGYAAQAVHFDGATWLVNAALASSDNGDASFALFYKDDSSPANSPIYWISDPSNCAGAYLGFGNAQNNAQAAFADATCNQIFSSGFASSEDVWHSVIASTDGTTLKVYLDDVSVGGAVTGSITTSFFNGLALWVGSDGTHALVGDMADLWIAPGVSLLTAGDIPLATRRKFVDAGGKPVSLGSDGSLPTGTVPAVFLSASSGNAASFATNRGTGGAFTTTGTLTLASGP